MEMELSMLELELPICVYTAMVSPRYVQWGEIVQDLPSIL